ncbi:MAG: recombinase family protein [bacterium]|nr:recombinase family protein [bacterium]
MNKQYNSLIKTYGIDKISEMTGLPISKLRQFASSGKFPQYYAIKLEELNSNFSRDCKNNNFHENKCMIVSRVSSIKQTERFSLTEQANYCSDYAKRKGFTNIVERPITESAWKSKKRKEFSKLLEEATMSKIKTLVFYDFSRLSRNVSETTKLISLIKNDKMNIHIATSDIFLSKDSTEEDFGLFQARILDAQRESDRKSSRSKSSAKALLSVGRYPGSILPLGYKRKMQIITKVEEEAELVKFIFNEYATERCSLRTLLPEVRKKAILLGLSKTLSLKVMDNLLHNSFYIGEMKWHGKLYKGTHEAIIDKDLFLKVQENLMSNSIRKQKTHRNLPFQNIFYCKECGTVLTPDIKKEKYIYHFCNKCKNDNKIYLRVNNQDRKEILNKLSSKLTFKKDKLDLLTKITLYSDGAKKLVQIENAKRLLSIKEKELKNLISSFPVNISPTVREQFDNLIKEKGEELDTLKESLQSDGESDNLSRERIAYLFENLPLLFIKADDESKSKIVKMFFPEITVDLEKDIQCKSETEIKSFLSS